MVQIINFMKKTELHKALIYHVLMFSVIYLPKLYDENWGNDDGFIISEIVISIILAFLLNPNLISALFIGIILHMIVTSNELFYHDSIGIQFSNFWFYILGSLFFNLPIMLNIIGRRIFKKNKKKV